MRIHSAKWIAIVGLIASMQAVAQQCIPSGVMDQYTYLVAVDATDHTTRETGLASFTVYRSRNGGAAAAFTTPTVNETDATNMPGVYELLLDEDMTIDAGDDVQHMVLHITHAGMTPVTKEICIARPKITAGNTLTVASDGDLTEVNTLTGHTAQTGDAYARLGAPAGASISADILVLDNFVDDVESRLGTPSDLGTGATLAANAADIEAQTDDIGAAGAGLTAADDAVMTRLGAPAGASVSADVAAVKVDTAAILDDTGTTGVLISTAAANCRAPLGCSATGTLSGTHSATTADLGTNAPGATSDLVGKTLVIPAKYFARMITAYNTTTGVATFDTTALTLADGDVWYLFETAPGSGSVNVTQVEGTDATDYFATIDDAVMTRLGPPVGASLSADLQVIDTNVDDVETDTADMQPKLGTFADLGSGATLSGNLEDMRDDGTAVYSRTTDSLQAIRDRGDAAWTGASTNITQIEGVDATDQIDARLAAIRLDELLAADSDIDGAAPPTVGSVFHEALSATAGSFTFDQTTDSLEAIRDSVATRASQTSVDTVDDLLDTEIADISNRLPAALVGGRIDSSTGAMAANVMTAAAAAADLTTELQAGIATSAALSSLSTTVGTPAGASVSADVAAVKADTAATLIDTAEIGVAGAGLTAVDDAVLAAIEQTARADAAVINCEVNTANFAGSTTTLACVLTDRDGGAVAVASGDLTGRELLILSGAQLYEGRYVRSTTWDAANSELQVTLDRALPATLADAVTAIIR